MQLLPLVPLPAGRVKLVFVPAAAATLIVAFPLVPPYNLTLPATVVFAPSVKAPDERQALAFVAGAVPAPPPATIQPAANRADDAVADVLLK